MPKYVFNYFDFFKDEPLNPFDEKEEDEVTLEGNEDQTQGFTIGGVDIKQSITDSADQATANHQNTDQDNTSNVSASNSLPTTNDSSNISNKDISTDLSSTTTSSPCPGTDTSTIPEDE